MSYGADKQVIDTHTDRYTDRGDDNTLRPKLASGKNDPWKIMDVRVFTGLVCPAACLLWLTVNGDWWQLSQADKARAGIAPVENETLYPQENCFCSDKISYTWSVGVYSFTQTLPKWLQHGYVISSTLKP